jgi:hypothetical protein
LREKISQKKLLSERSFSGHTVVDLFGDRRTYTEITTSIGRKINIPDLPYIQFSGEDTVRSLTSMGLSQNIASSFVELSDAISAGKIKPTQIDPTKPNTPTTFEQFIEEVFLPVYNS